MKNLYNQWFASFISPRVIGGIGLLLYSISFYLSFAGYNEFLRYQIFSLTDPKFWLYFLLTIVMSIYAIIIPGSIFIKKYVTGFIPKLALSSCLGLVLWGFQGFIFGFIDFRMGTYVYLVITLIFWILQNKKFSVYTSYSVIKKKIFTFDRILYVLLALGIFVMVLPMWFIGYRSQGAIDFCCFWPDNLYHLAIVNQLVLNVPPIEPGAHSVIMQNYHYFANLIMGDFVRVFHIPLMHLHNQYVPVLVSLLLGLIIITFARSLDLPKNFTRFLLFFIFFSGDILFLILLVLGQPINFFVSISENATSMWFSPPRVFAMVTFFASLTLFILWLKSKDFKLGLIMALCVASLIGMKVYIAGFLFLGLAPVGLYFLIRRQWQMTIPLIVAVILGLAIYLPVNPHSGGLVYTGLWRIEDFAVKKELGLINLELARMIFIQHSNYLRIFIIEALYMGLFIISLAGMFLIGFIQSRKSLSKFPHLLHTVLLTGLLITTCIGLFFIQETGGSNTSQFFMSTYLVGSCYAALACSYWIPKIRNKKVMWILLVVVCGISGTKVLAETHQNIDDILHREGYLVVQSPEIRVYEYMRNNIPVSAKIIANPEYSMENNCYYGAYLSNKVPYLCGAGILFDHGVKIQDRIDVVDTVFTNKDPNVVLNALKDNNISYMYISDLKKYTSIVQSTNYEIILEEDNFVLLKIK